MRSYVKKELPGGCQTAEGAKAEEQAKVTSPPSQRQQVRLGHIKWLKSEPKPDDYNADYLTVALDDEGEVFIHPGLLGVWGPIMAAADATFLWCPGEPKPMLVSVSWAIEMFPSQTDWLREFAGNVRRNMAKEKGEAK
jgi:hypothetical protein